MHSKDNTDIGSVALLPCIIYLNIFSFAIKYAEISYEDLNTYDLSPFPYMPIIVDSTDFLLDFPNVMMSDASSIKPWKRNKNEVKNELK